MAERKIAGKDMFLLIGTQPNVFSTVVCLTTKTLSRTTDEIDAATQCGPDTLPGALKNSVTFEGSIALDPAAGRISDDDLDDYWRNTTTIYFKITELNPTIGSIIYSGSGFISQLDDTWALNDPSTFSGKLGIYGLVNKTTATS